MKEITSKRTKQTQFITDEEVVNSQFILDVSVNDFHFVVLDAVFSFQNFHHEAVFIQKFVSELIFAFEDQFFCSMLNSSFGVTYKLEVVFNALAGVFPASVQWAVSIFFSLGKSSQGDNSEQCE